ncbi:hypothetical protein [Actinacidiphila soli]|uniref:hypothetical protein n=1 Tax=Actinacidiphila soli TaxID=2487275 RepID=UPI000FCAD086|nr:hypothetical protein [Actinacidiphila soli]
MAVGTALLALAAVGTTSAQAAAPATVHPNNCGTDSTHEFSAVKSQRVGMVPPSSAPGGHALGITLAAGTSITGTVSGSVTGEAVIIVANAKETVSASLARSITASVS